jgi:hypothetical protein
MLGDADENGDAMSVTRRAFVKIAGVLFGGLLVPGLTEAHSKDKRKRKHHGHGHGRDHKRGIGMYRWSGRGRRVSRAALAHAANRRYATIGAARRDLPHRGAHLRLVRVNVSAADFFRLFLRRRRLVVDLRKL